MPDIHRQTIQQQKDFTIVENKRFIFDACCIRYKISMPLHLEFSLQENC